MRARITGDKELLAQFKDLAASGPEIVREFVTDLTVTVHRKAVRGIQRGPASGRIYEKYRPRRTHQASAPGEYPSSDTGKLAGSVEFELPTATTKQPEGIVGTSLLYGKYLQFKSETRGGRPWLSRAFNEGTAESPKILRRLFKRRNGV